MRLWHIDLLPFLPEMQFKGQLREMMAILHDWRDKGRTNHLLINRVMVFPKNDFAKYFLAYEAEFYNRYGKFLTAQWREVKQFNDTPVCERMKDCFDDWHNKEYLRVCMANLYEKHIFGIGKSRISDEDWHKLVLGYNQITGEEYEL